MDGAKRVRLQTDADAQALVSLSNMPGHLLTSIARQLHPSQRGSLRKTDRKLSTVGAAIDTVVEGLSLASTEVQLHGDPREQLVKLGWHGWQPPESVARRTDAESVLRFQDGKLIPWELAQANDIASWLSHLVGQASVAVRVVSTATDEWIPTSPQIAAAVDAVAVAVAVLATHVPTSADQEDFVRRSTGRSLTILRPQQNRHFVRCSVAFEDTHSAVPGIAIHTLPLYRRSDEGEWRTADRGWSLFLIRTCIRARILHKLSDRYGTALFPAGAWMVHWFVDDSVAGTLFDDALRTEPDLADPSRSVLRLVLKNSVPDNDKPPELTPLAAGRQRQVAFWADRKAARHPFAMLGCVQTLYTLPQSQSRT